MQRDYASHREQGAQRNPEGSRKSGSIEKTSNTPGLVQSENGHPKSPAASAEGIEPYH